METLLTHRDSRSPLTLEGLSVHGLEILDNDTAISLVIGSLMEQLDLHRRAVEARNPYQPQLLEVAEGYQSLISEQLEEGAFVELGGSLASQTAIRGKNDIDLKVLLPQTPDMGSSIAETSSRIAGIIPFEKVSERQCGDTNALKHEVVVDFPDIEGPVQIDCMVMPGDGRVGYARMQALLPTLCLDQYVLYKTDTLGDRASYKKVKQQFYALTRQLYSWGYMGGETDEAERSQLLAAASDTLWGNNLNQILARPTPEI
ncbi:hypothetical protein KW789_01035 [Candidatus Saccharibacteria bacterium]|nr:hypothetical protein [Candidatus Saccharibacteria bacterium]